MDLRETDSVAMDSSPHLQSKIPGTCPRLEWLAILEPHDSSLKDNAVKAVGLAKFAEHYWSLFARIQLIRKKKQLVEWSGISVWTSGTVQFGKKCWL